MTWQEYQEAAARPYEQAEGIGTVRRNAYLPGRVTGQKRQIAFFWRSMQRAT
jgi:hypothetical protein